MTQSFENQPGMRRETSGQPLPIRASPSALLASTALTTAPIKTAQIPRELEGIVNVSGKFDGSVAVGNEDRAADLLVYFRDLSRVPNIEVTVSSPNWAKELAEGVARAFGKPLPSGRPPIEALSILLSMGSSGGIQARLFIKFSTAADVGFLEKDQVGTIRALIQKREIAVIATMPFGPSQVARTTAYFEFVRNIPRYTEKA